jgi:hypothetical protein
LKLHPNADAPKATAAAGTATKKLRTTFKDPGQEIHGFFWQFWPKP